MFRFKYFVLQFALIFALKAQIVPGQFIVELSGDPAITNSASVADHRRVQTEMVMRRVSVRDVGAVVRQQLLRVINCLRCQRAAELPFECGSLWPAAGDHERLLRRCEA